MTASTLETPAQVDDATLAVNELHEATAQTDSLLADLTGKSAVVEKVSKEITEKQIDVLRARAQKERARGLKSIERRYDGIASVMMDIKLNERVVGSAFERFFPVIENGLYIITKRGEMFMGAKQTEQIMGMIKDKITVMESNISTDMAGLKIQLDVHGERDDFLKPTYIKPASEHKIQLRTPMAVRIAKVFQEQDKIIMNLQTLAWNGEVEGSAIDDQELRIKKDIRDLATFIARALRGMRNRVAPKEKPAAETVTVSVAEVA